MEKKNLGKRKVETKEKFLIVSGLARAGTTSLMNKLVSNPALDSLSYANMPFITAPNYWSKIYKPKDTEKKERSHKDGIMIGLDSFEALEEYFFKMLAQDSYIRENSLDKYELSEVDKDDYLTYQAVVRSNNDNTYLAKNNNFLLRYESLRETNKEFVVVFMYREPLSHAASLLQKHKEFSKDQEEDGFVLEYMDWLGHHEFGLHHKPFQFEGSLEFETKDQMSLDYWLEVWINYYSYLLTIDRQNTLFIDYDEYCNQPKKVIESVLETMKITDIESEYSPFNNQRKVDYSYSTTLYSKAGKLYAELKSTGRKDH